MEIFVGNLPDAATAEGLNRLFGGYGTASGFVILNRVLRDGRRLRFALGVISPDRAARRAIRERHLQSYGDKRLLVLERVHRDFRTERRRSSLPYAGRERRGRELWLGGPGERRRWNRRGGDRRMRERRRYDRRINSGLPTGRFLSIHAFSDKRKSERRAGERRGADRRAAERRGRTRRH